MPDMKSTNGGSTTNMSDRTARWAIYYLSPMPSGVHETAVSHIVVGPKPGRRSVVVSGGSSMAAIYGLDNEECNVYENIHDWIH